MLLVERKVNHARKSLPNGELSSNALFPFQYAYNEPYVGHEFCPKELYYLLCENVPSTTHSSNDATTRAQAKRIMLVNLCLFGVAVKKLSALLSRCYRKLLFPLACHLEGKEHSQQRYCYLNTTNTNATKRQYWQCDPPQLDKEQRDCALHFYSFSCKW